jgi:uncharacterized MAPEG superfamily protein
MYVIVYILLLLVQLLAASQHRQRHLGRKQGAGPRADVESQEDQPRVNYDWKRAHRPVRVPSFLFSNL